MRKILLGLVVIAVCVLLASGDLGRASQGIYRLPFADGTVVKVFDDFNTHRPNGRIDLYAVGGEESYRVFVGVIKLRRTNARCGQEGVGTIPKPPQGRYENAKCRRGLGGNSACSR